MAYIKNVMVMVLQLAFQSRRNCEQYVTVRPIVLPIIPSDSIGLQLHKHWPTLYATVFKLTYFKTAVNKLGVRTLL